MFFNSAKKGKIVDDGKKSDSHIKVLKIISRAKNIGMSLT